MKITKKEFIQKLYEIEEKENLKLGREVQRVIRNEIVPIEVIKLINKYDSNFMRIYDTYNTIHDSRSRNPLYRNLRNEHLSIPETAIAVSSLVTKILISCSKIEDSQERQIFARAMNVDAINEALTQYAENNDESKLIECIAEIRELLKLLYED